jgi:hypothetical protein
LHWSPKRTAGGGDGHTNGQTRAGGRDGHTNGQTRAGGDGCTNGQTISIKSTAENTDDITSPCKMKMTKHTKE